MHMPIDVMAANDIIFFRIPAPATQYFVSLLSVLNLEDRRPISLVADITSGAKVTCN